MLWACIVAACGSITTASASIQALGIDADAAEREAAPSRDEARSFAFRPVPARESGLAFVHRSGRAGAAKGWMLECVGAGLALFDADGDGDLDLYFPQGGGVDEAGVPEADPEGDQLYLNDGRARFSRATTGELGRGFAFGVCAADVDADGDEDLFVACLGANRLLLNDGHGRFTPAPDAGGLAGGARDWSVAAAFADADGDGDLDAYVVNYLAHDLSHPQLGGPSRCRWLGCVVPCGPRGLDAQADRFFLNDGTGRFTEAGDACGLGQVAPAYGFQASWTDADGDGDPDLFVANDTLPNFLFENLGPAPDGRPRFREVALRAGVALSDVGREQAGMGVAAGDVDGDGGIDLFLTNFSQEPNTLYRNASTVGSGPLYFDETARSGLAWPSYFDLAWGASFLDADLDGDLDLYVANGHVYPQVDGCELSRIEYAQRDRLFENAGGGVFLDASERAGEGLRLRLPSRGCAAGDLDGDGDLDLVVTTLDGPPVLLLNETEHAGGWLAVAPAPPAAAVGARVVLLGPVRPALAEIRRGSSFLGAEPLAVHFGLGEAPGERWPVRVRWRDGLEEVFDVEVGRVNTVVRGQGRAP